MGTSVSVEWLFSSSRHICRDTWSSLKADSWWMLSLLVPANSSCLQHSMFTSLIFLTYVLDAIGLYLTCTPIQVLPNPLILLHFNLFYSVLFLKVLYPFLTDWSTTVWMTDEQAPICSINCIKYSMLYNWNLSDLTLIYFLFVLLVINITPFAFAWLHHPMCPLKSLAWMTPALLTELALCMDLGLSTTT